MRSKNISRNKIVEHKKRMTRHEKKTEEKANIDEIAKEKVKTDEVIKEKVKTDDVIKKKIAKNKTTNEITKNRTTKEIAADKKKRIIRKRPSKEYIDGIKRRAEERAYRIAEGTEEEFHEDREEPKHEISKEERAERFKKLHEMAVRMTNQWKENK